jgi:hypothetical protein
MNTKVLAGLVLFLTAWAVSPARADLFAIAVDVPVTYSFDEAVLGDPDASGIIVGLSLPFLVGLGYESYKVTGDTVAATAQAYEYKVNMVDVFLDLPFPVANLVLGVGLGRGTFEIPTSTLTFKDANLSQFFFSIGIPFAVLFDVHVGYRVIGGKADASDGTELNLGSEMATVGLKVGF